MNTITKEVVISRRLDNQQVSGGGFMRPESLVAWMGCIQAQDFAGAKWAIGSRLQHGTDAAVQQAFNEGKILRTHILRPTWHFVAPADIHWMLALTAPRITAFCAGMHRQLELDQATFKKSNATLHKALAGGRQLTRKELLPLFRQAKIRTDELRLAHLLMQAELDGIICSGAMNGKQFTYALMEERAPGGKRLDPEEALGELALRYFKSRGPATLADFAWWSGLTVTDAKKGVEAHRSQFIREEVEEQNYWIHSAYPPLSPGNRHTAHPHAVPGSPPPVGEPSSPHAAGSSPSEATRSSPPTTRSSPASAAAPSPLPAAGIRILPAFDEYTVAYKDRDLVLAPKHAQRSGNGIFKPIILNEGRITGTWQRTMHKDHIAITTDLFRPLGRRALKAAFAGYEAFMQTPLVYHFD